MRLRCIAARVPMRDGQGREGRREKRNTERKIQRESNTLSSDAQLLTFMKSFKGISPGRGQKTKKSTGNDINTAAVGGRELVAGAKGSRYD